LTNATVKPFERFSYGELKLFEDSEIEQNMKYDLSWDNSEIICESEFERSYKGSPSEYNEYKTKFMTEVKLKKRFSSKWKSKKKEWPIFDMLPHFAISRLHVFHLINSCLMYFMFAFNFYLYPQQYGLWNEDG
jgi:hypothetical protein